MIWRDIRWPSWTVGLLATLVFASSAFAHSASTAYLQLTASGHGLAFQLELPLRDLDDRVGLDANDDGQLTWGELRSRQRDLESLVRQNLAIGPETNSWKLDFSKLRVSERAGEGYAVLDFSVTRPPTAAIVSLNYRLFFSEDPLHRCLVAFNMGLHSDSSAPAVGTAILSPDHSRLALDLRGGSVPAPTSLTAFIREGTHHIWTGYDHLLFLLALLLPAVLRRTPQGWEPAPSLRDALFDVLKVVTAFTVAHSLTLALAAFEVIRLPSRLVESTIAASIIVAALANLWPRRKSQFTVRHHPWPGPQAVQFAVVPIGVRAMGSTFRVDVFRDTIHVERVNVERSKGTAPRAAQAQEFPAWKIAFVFGLIHGFGFAGVLGELGLQHHQLAVPLFGFNLGVELGQLVCVAIFVPIAFWLRSSRFYQKAALPLGSLLIIALAGGWLVERAFNLGFMPI